MTCKVALFKGGVSAERDVSLASGTACAKALREAGYDVTEIDVGKDISLLIKQLQDLAPAVVFNALHGRWGEDGCVQGLLELLGIPYTHSGVLSSALAMHKERTKTMVSQVGVRVPESKTIQASILAKGDPLPRPYVIKPLSEGSSVGVHIVFQGDNHVAMTRKELGFDGAIMVERYIPGRELTVAVMGDKPLAVTELVPKQGFYSYEAKYTEGKTEHIIPAKVPAEIYEEALESALKAHQVLGCSGVSRSDFRYDDTPEGDGKLYYLETNTQPGMTDLSLVPEQAKYLGMSFPELCAWMVEDALRSKEES
ncbi:D-alanine--D-alanine ligase [Kiloniella laminariae]|uniref:D-alanine--D-alanine ligase n=1 Tax=Kiloniella laminariae TaxID=454162 RepID=A0ABT4LDW3_9PROT|nr:D-alanine--D-alanine ligase [Kiloniella laminariae]MCZ4279290.1 D-alanine--D-alanine ligase [Kiloniella laminariae]